jgi:hypothetical protein
MGNNARYCFPEHLLRATDFASIGVASGGESADPDYQLAALHDLDPKVPFKATDGSVALDIVWAGAAPVVIQYVGLTIHNIKAGSAVLFQGHNANVWDAPAMSAPLSIAAPIRSGHSRAPWTDLTQVAGYDPAGFLFYRLHVPANDGVAVQLGEVVLATEFLELPHNPLWGISHARRHPELQGMTTGAEVESRYTLPIRNRRITGRVVHPDTMRVFHELHEATAGGLPFVFVLDPTDETDGGWLAQLGAASAAEFVWTDVHPRYTPVDVEILEVSRGLPL